MAYKWLINDQEGFVYVLEMIKWAFTNVLIVSCAQFTALYNELLQNEKIKPKYVTTLQISDYWTMKQMKMDGWKWKIVLHF